MEGGRRWRDLVVAAADLALGAECAGCGDPALRLCRICRATLVPDPEPAQVGPTSLLPGEAESSEDVRWLASAARDYDELMARVVVAWKERGWTSLTDDLGLLLASAVLDVAGEATALDLVPTPTSRRNRRRRGRDHAVDLAEAAARCLRATGVDARSRPLLRATRATRDQAGLGAREREHNVAGAFVVSRRSAAALSSTALSASCRALVVVDDVTTTGATLREAARALDASGLPCVGAAVVAARR